MRRGLTLIEVLAAVALLAIIAAGVVPTLQALARQSAAVREDDAAEAVSIEDLRLVADAAMARPGQLLAAGGLPPRDGATVSWGRAIRSARLPLDADAMRPPITARALLPEADDVDRAWIVFECDGVQVFRIWRGRVDAAGLDPAGARDAVDVDDAGDASGVPGASRDADRRRRSGGRP